MENETESRLAENEFFVKCRFEKSDGLNTMQGLAYLWLENGNELNPRRAASSGIVVDEIRNTLKVPGVARY